MNSGEDKLWKIGEHNGKNASQCEALATEILYATLPNVVSYT